MTNLFFCPERWEPDAVISTNVAKQMRVRGFDGKPAAAWQIGDFGSRWTAITSQIPIEAGWLEPGLDYRLCFWLNGGENAKGDEVCNLEVFGDAWEDRLTFRLNRDYTRPILEKNGWLLFGVPFTAPAAAEALTFRFVAAGAVCTITGIPDMDMSACEACTPDERQTGLPQRHNVVYPDGYPGGQKKIVLRAPRGKSVSVPMTVLKIAAGAAGAAMGIALLHHMRKKNDAKRGGNTL